MHIDEVNGAFDLQRTSGGFEAHTSCRAMYTLKCDGRAPTCRAELSDIRRHNVLLRGGKYDVANTRFGQHRSELCGGPHLSCGLRWW